MKTRKRFSEKPIVVFTNSTVFILDFYILLSLWSHVLAWSSLILKKGHIVSCQEDSVEIRNIFNVPLVEGVAVDETPS